ncbi:hypothetical protein [Nibrella saemangeumensis]
MYKIILWGIAILLYVYAVGVTYVENDLSLGLVLAALSSLISPETEDNKKLFKDIPVWVRYLLGVIITVVCFYYFCKYNQPIKNIFIDTSKISNPVTKKTEYTIILMDIGAGYLLLFYIYFFSFFLYFIGILLIIDWGYLGILFIIHVFKKGFNKKNITSFKSPFSNINYHIFIYISVLIFILWFFFPSYKQILLQIKQFVFGTNVGISICKFSTCITRLSNVFISIGAAPSLAKIWSAFVSITSIWASFEGASNMFKFLTKKLNTESSQESKEVNS